MDFEKYYQPPYPDGNHVQPCHCTPFSFCLICSPSEQCHCSSTCRASAADDRMHSMYLEALDVLQPSLLLGASTLPIQPTDPTVVGHDYLTPIFTQDSDDTLANEEVPSQATLSQAPSKMTSHQRRFACPFYQHNPSPSGRPRSCTGPGFPSIAKLKEHFKRCHYPSARGSGHSPLPVGENRRHRHPHSSPEQPLDDEILDERQREIIKKRDRRSTEEEKWRDIYHVMFGRGAQDRVACSPYHETTASHNERPCMQQQSSLTPSVEGPQLDLLAFTSELSSETGQRLLAGIEALLSEQPMTANIPQAVLNITPQLVSLLTDLAIEHQVHR
jgi:hypothetical protein